MLQRISGIYLWIALLPAILVGQVRNLAGTEALLVGYAIFVALTAAAIWKIGATKTDEGLAREHPAFVPGVLLIAGPLALFLGASVTGEPTAARPGDYLLNTTAILVGSVILVAGFVALSVRLWEAGERLLPALGISGLLVGAAPWLANLVFRYAVVASGAAGLQAGAEDRAWVAYEYLRGLEGEPSWMEFLLVWIDTTQLAFVLLAYLSAAAFGAALVRAGWLGKVGGGIFVGLNLALAFVVTTGVVLAASGSVVAAWTVFVLTIPFMAFILPYFAGVALARLTGGEMKAATRPNVNRRFVLLVAFTLLAWLGMFLHNAVDLPALTVLSPENSLPALVSGTLVIGWRLLPWKRAVAVALLAWSLLHLVGGGVLSVLPLAVWPYTPAQTLTHYAMHLVYGLAQLPLIWLLMRWLQPRRRSSAPVEIIRERSIP